jgi:hypothetical protein
MARGDEKKFIADGTAIVERLTCDWFSTGHAKSIQPVLSAISSSHIRTSRFAVATSTGVFCAVYSGTKRLAQITMEALKPRDLIAPDVKTCTSLTSLYVTKTVRAAGPGRTASGSDPFRDMSYLPRNAPSTIVAAICSAKVGNVTRGRYAPDE